MTYSFFCKSNLTGTFTINFLDQDNTRQFSTSYSLASANTWERIIINIPADTTGAFTNDNATSFFVQMNLQAGTDKSNGALTTAFEASAQGDRGVGQTNFFSSTSNNWYITGCQLEVGDAATDFEHLPFDVQLRRCQRYFQLFNDGSYDNEGLMTATLYTNSTAYGYIYLQTPMRAGPSLYEVTGTDYWVAYTNNSNNTFDDMGINGDASNTFVCEIYVPSSGNLSLGSGGQSCFIRTHNAASRLGADAEL
jgi:hypothetical protein